MKHFAIKDRMIGQGHQTFIVAEMSANHNMDFEKAIEIIEAAKEAGADAVKLQTYTPDTITIDCENEFFQIRNTIWKGKRLYKLYEEAHTPWEWHPKLKEVAEELGLLLFSTPFDASAVSFLEKMEVPAYKVASFEIVDIPLLKKIAETSKPVIISTGMATLAEIDEAVRTIRNRGNDQIALLKCTSSYPAPPAEMNLRTISHMAQAFGSPVGLSDHTLGSAVAVAGVALGACIVEKHLTLSRDDPGPDSSFSMEPREFKNMVDDIRTVEKALGKVSYEASEKQKENKALRRSLFVVMDILQGEEFTENNLRSIRPGNGLHTRYYGEILGRRAKVSVKKGTPLTWDHLI